MGQAAKTYTVEIPEKVFNPAYIPYIDPSAARATEIFYGGSSSGKSNFVAHRVVLDVMRGGHNYLCVRKLSKTVTKSVFNEIAKAITDFGARDLFRLVPSASYIECANGYQILFSGLDDPEKIKSITPAKGVVTDVWYEEATEAAPEDIKQLRKRLRGLAAATGDITKRITMSFNPIYQTHWVVKEYFTANGWADDQKFYEDDSLRIIKTTHIDNQFLTKQDHQELENEADSYWYQVYTLGNWGILGDAILTNWRTEDLSGRIVEFDNIRNGIDFGYSADPASYVRVHYDRVRKKIYIFQGFEGLELTNPVLARKVKPFAGEDEPVFCDSAEPKSIQELRDNNINAVAVKKGPDSVLHSIQWLQQHEIIVDISLQHIVNELSVWKWKEDKDGNSLPIPENNNNHSIDATRYALEVESAGMMNQYEFEDYPE